VCAEVHTFPIIFIFCNCSLNILLAGSDTGQLAMYAYGVVHLVQLDLTHLGKDNVSYYLIRKFSNFAVLASSVVCRILSGCTVLGHPCQYDR
jgi:hypothetical protein